MNSRMWSLNLVPMVWLVYQVCTQSSTNKSLAKQQASRATIQDLQEMSLRIELIFRMARELQKGKKQTVVAVTRQEPAVVQQIVAVSFTSTFIPPLLLTL